jgi:hypothetical protein
MTFLKTIENSQLEASSMRDGNILTYYPADDQTKNGNECLSKKPLTNYSRNLPCICRHPRWQLPNANSVGNKVIFSRRICIITPVLLWGSVKTLFPFFRLQDVCTWYFEYKESLSSFARLWRPESLRTRTFLINQEGRRCLNFSLHIIPQNMHIKSIYTSALVCFP